MVEFEVGRTRIGVSLATGAGKTVVFLTLLSRLQPPAGSPSATRSLVIVNSIELARQAARQSEKLFPEWSVEIEQGSKYVATGKADLYVLLVHLALYYLAFVMYILEQSPHTRRLCGLLV